MIKRILLKGAIFLPFAILYNVLEVYLGDTWLTAGVFSIVLISLRIGLYLYRRSKGIKDTWPNDQANNTVNRAAK
ncbi:MAG TPA: hypothetical protein VGC62_15480 [Pseudomonas sp.]|uniref:hypothetical protein n=1 Tax=Pseudomonas sp. TaxID=306 RepID=UPI002EDB8FE1